MITFVSALVSDRGELASWLRDLIAAFVLAFAAAYIAVWGRKRDDD